MNENRTVLIIEDNKSWIDALSLFFERKGFHTTKVSNYRIAHDKILECKYDLALIDIRLDDSNVLNIDGIDLLDLISRKYPSTKRVLLTAYPENIRKEAIYKNADNVLVKGNSSVFSSLKEIVSDLN